ncbi:hypothetical protein GGR50DRAFT_223820 [Xylaria sp. CBS 124048]|nr:hypothetical protein GGR50DRAFT_223820 [Xylaria sp. CBS 124048]
MFVHSGASLHGHVFSKRASPAVVGPSNLRHPLRRSTFSPVANRATAQPLESPAPSPVASDSKRPRTYSAPPTPASGHARMDFHGPKSDAPSARSEDLSEDEESVASDTNVTRVSSVRRKRRSRARKSTTYVLAHPPPKPRTKQRIIHIRPSLVLQMQRVTPGLRPIPAIDVYPSSTMSRSIMAPPLNCSPLAAGIKRELSNQDILLVRSEDYDSQPLGSDIDQDDEEGIVARDVLAVVCPSKTEDKAEIVMSDGMVWAVSTRSSGNTFVYEFTSVGPLGATITARWVRKHNIRASLPVTSVSTPASIKPHFPDSKFTFSFIDPSSRRHPILATLTSASLTIPDTYTTISQTPNQSPPLSRGSSSPDPSSNGDQNEEEGDVRPVEQWQKSFILISSVWVALRNGWAVNFRPPIHGLATSQAEGHVNGRQRSVSLSTNFSPTALHAEVAGMRKTQQQMPRYTSKLHMRTKSVGSNLRQTPEFPQGNDENSASKDEDSRLAGLDRRALSGDWSVGLPKRARDNKSTTTEYECVEGTHNNNVQASFKKTDTEKSHSTLAPAPMAPPPMPCGRRSVSALYLPFASLSFDKDKNNAEKHLRQPKKAHTVDAATQQQQAKPQQKRSFTFSRRGGCDTSQEPSQGRRQKWKNVTNWFRKLSER